MSDARILVLEDERPMRMVLQECIEADGYRVIVAEDGEQGLERTQSEELELFLLDVMIPKIDGFTLCAALRRLGMKQPILMLTAKGQVELECRGSMPARMITW